MFRKLYPDPTVNALCTQFEVNNWLISEFVLKELLPVVGTHPFPLGELALMVAAACRLKPTHIFDWGTHLGKSARIFYEISKGFGLPIEIHSTDLPEKILHKEHPGENLGVFLKGILEVKLHSGDGLTRSLEVARKLPPKSRFLFFLDGDHSFRSVRRELEAITKAFPRANILIHDTFYQSRKSGYNIGPYQAIKNLMSKTAISYKKISTDTGLPGMTLLYQNKNLLEDDHS